MLKQGDFYEEQVTVSQQQVNAFAELSGDKNPVHIDEAFAAQTSFKKPIVHGIFSAAIFSRILGTVFPGQGSIYLGQTLQFKRPVYPGEAYTARVQITGIDGRNSATFSTVLTHTVTGKVVVDGEAKVMNKNLLP